MRSHTAVRAAATSVFAIFALTACSSGVLSSPTDTLRSDTPTATASSAADAVVDTPAGVENPENRPIVVLTADQTDVTVPVGTMIYFDVTKDQGWTSSPTGDALEMEDVFVEGTMEENPYWGMYRAVQPGAGTITVSILDGDGKISETFEYSITVE